MTKIREKSITERVTLELAGDGLVWPVPCDLRVHEDGRYYLASKAKVWFLQVDWPGARGFEEALQTARKTMIMDSLPKLPLGMVWEFPTECAMEYNSVEVPEIRAFAHGKFAISLWPTDTDPDFVDWGIPSGYDSRVSKYAEEVDGFSCAPDIADADDILGALQEEVTMRQALEVVAKAARRIMKQYKKHEAEAGKTGDHEESE